MRCLLFCGWGKCKDGFEMEMFLLLRFVDVCSEEVVVVVGREVVWCGL